MNKTTCKKCKITITNLRKHLTRNRCGEQHIRKKDKSIKQSRFKNFDEALKEVQENRRLKNGRK